MDKTKASQIVGILISQDFEPTIKRNGDEFTVSVATPNGVLIDQLKQFQDNNQVTIKARVVEIT